MDTPSGQSSDATVPQSETQRALLRIVDHALTIGTLAATIAHQYDTKREALNESALRMAPRIIAAVEEQLSMLQAMLNEAAQDPTSRAD